MYYHTMVSLQVGRHTSMNFKLHIKLRIFDLVSLQLFPDQNKCASSIVIKCSWKKNKSYFNEGILKS